MSDRQLAKERQARNLLAARIAAVLRQRQKIGAERRAHEREYQRLNNDRALARYYRLTGDVVARLEYKLNPQLKLANSLNSLELGGTFESVAHAKFMTIKAKPEPLIVVRLRVESELNGSIESEVIKKPVS